MITVLIKDERPLQFFGATGLALIFVAIALAIPLATEYLRSGLVPRLPTAVLCSALMVTGTLSIFAGLIMDIITKSRQEMKRLFYLSIPSLRTGSLALGDHDIDEDHFQ